MRTPRPGDLRRFCVVDGWACVPDAPGRRVSGREVWTKRLPDGRALHTAISKGRDEYGVALFPRILRSRLHVTAAQFWAAVDISEAPQRPGVHSSRPHGEPLPFALAEALLAAGLPQAELAGLGQAEAERLLAELERR